MNQEIEDVYFPVTCAVSMINVLSDGACVEVAIVGHEGLVGLSVFLEQKKAFSRTVVEVPGEAVKVKARVLKDHKYHLPQLNHFLMRYADIFFRQTFISSGCNRFHSLDQRIARWLLDHNERHPAHTKVFPFTHDFLAEMLGVHRSTVTQVTDKMQKNGLIQYKRGRMEIVNDKKLVGLACECYHIVKEALDEFVGHLERSQTGVV
jgi:CRP-like cAMP-binding protein